MPTRVTLKRTLRRVLDDAGPIQVIGLVLAAAALPAAVLQYFGDDWASTQEVITAWFLACGSLALLLALFYQRRWYEFNDTIRDYQQGEERQRRMETGFERLHDAFHILRDASYALSNRALDKGPLTPQDDLWFYGELTKSVGKFAEFFELHTGSQCHAVIKSIVGEGDNDEALVRTVCRSHPHGVRREFNSVPLNLNSDYLEILQGGKRYFFSSCISEEKDYRNPTLGVPHRYESTIVWPIRAGAETGLVLEGGADTIGFLGLDSPARDVFDDPAHVFLGAAYADSLYSAMSLLALFQYALGPNDVDIDLNDNAAGTKSDAAETSGASVSADKPSPPTEASTGET